MGQRMLSKLEESLTRYQSEHHGEKPLYILVSPTDIEHLLKDVREQQGFPGNSVITTYQDSRIVNYNGLKQGELRLTNDLPDTGS